MNARRLTSVLMGVLALCGIGLLVSVYWANTLLVSKSERLVVLKATNEAAAQQEADLAKAKQDVQTYSALNEIAKSVVPQDKDQSKTVSEIVKLASESGIGRLSSVAFPASTLGAAKQPKNSGGLTQVTQVKGLAGVYNMQITVTQANTEPVPYTSFIKFLSKLELNRRTAQVSSITVTPDPIKSDMVSFTLVIDEFMKP